MQKKKSATGRKGQSANSDKVGKGMKTIPSLYKTNIHHTMIQANSRQTFNHNRILTSPSEGGE